MPERVLTTFGDVGFPEKESIDSIVRSAQNENTKYISKEDNKNKKRKRESLGEGEVGLRKIHDGHRPSNGNVESGERATPQESSKYKSHESTTKNPFSREAISTQPILKQKAQQLWPVRKQLPIWNHSKAVRDGLRTKDIMLLVGETGSGKSTQVPQMLIQEPWFKSHLCQIQERKTRVGGCIAVTEPRRVAAISLARRVAEEMGSPLGSSSPASKVGYSVRFDNSTGPATQIKYLTEGMLLQEMLRDPFLKQYSAVIVDEVHERGVNVDLVLGFLKRMVVDKEGLDQRNGMGLKVVIMSATAEVDKLLDFFEPVPANNDIAYGTTNGTDKSEDDESEWAGISSSDEDKPSTAAPIKKNKKHVEKRLNDSVNGVIKQTIDSSDSKVSLCHIEGRQYPVSIHYTPEPVQDFTDAALRTIFQIHHAEPMPGDILVFLTGQEVVENLENIVNEYAQGLNPDVPKMLVLPLFAALPQQAQQRVFLPAPPKTRKVILATNIAETSVTLSGVRFVIDCGKSKQKQFRTNISLESLLVKPISKSSAIQRKGRAGREAPGKCYRLYTESSYLGLAESPIPEILRCDLSHALLTMKARGVVDIFNFPFLSAPPRDALEKALLLLLRLGAMNSSGAITEIGTKMARLPLPVQLSRTLLAAIDPAYDCVDEVIDIIACLSVENIFLQATSEDAKEAAESARRDIYHREGDHLTLLATVQAYVAETSDRKGWCQKHWVNHRAMKTVMDVRKQLRSLHGLASTTPISNDFKDTTERSSSSPPPASVLASAPTTQPSPSSKTSQILSSFITGFALNTARIVPDGSYRTIIGNQTVAVHPSSVLFGRRKIECIFYNEFVFTNKAYARGVSACRMDEVMDVLSL